MSMHLPAGKSGFGLQALDSDFGGETLVPWPSTSLPGRFPKLTKMSTGMQRGTEEKECQVFLMADG